MSVAFLVFARAPRLGEVKSRLAVGVGEDEALAVYRELGSLTLAAVRGAAAGTPDARVAVVYTPYDGAEEVAAWLGADVELVPQPDGDLGERMSSAIAREHDSGAECVVVVGTDCPYLTPALLCDAIERSASYDVVFGPADDGGYYLVALRAPQTALFMNVPWSSADTLNRTMEIASDRRLRVAMLPVLHDVDTAADLERWRRASL